MVYDPKKIRAGKNRLRGGQCRKAAGLAVGTYLQRGSAPPPPREGGGGTQSIMKVPYMVRKCDL